MCDIEKVFSELNGTLNEFYIFILNIVRFILNSNDIDKVTFHHNPTKNDPGSFAESLHSAGTILFKKNHRCFGNFVLIGKQGFDILKSLGHDRFDFKGRCGVLDSRMTIHYIPSMDDNRFILSVYEPNNFKDDNDYKTYYRVFKNMDAMVVGEIVNDEIEEKPETDDKYEEVRANSAKCDSKTHLIFGSECCGKTIRFKKIIQEKLRRDEDIFVFGTGIYGRLYFNDKSNNKLHFYSPKDVSGFSNNVDPESLAKHIVNFCCSLVGKDNTRTIAIDGFEQFKLNPDYTMSEYFRELTKECRVHNINFLYVLCSNTNDKKETYHNLPEIYERFSDVITVLK